MSIFLMEFEKESLKRARNIAYIEGYEPLMANQEKVLLRELETNCYVVGQYDYDARDLKLTGRKRKKKEEAQIDFISACLPRYDPDIIETYVEDTDINVRRQDLAETVEEKTVTPIKL